MVAPVTLRMWPRMQNIRLLCSSLCWIVVAIRVLLHVFMQASMGSWLLGGAVSADTLWTLAIVTLSACGTGAVDSESMLIPACSVPSALPRLMLKCRLLLTTMSFRLPNPTPGPSSPRALTIILMELLLSFPTALPTLPAARNWSTVVMPMGKFLKCLAKALKRRRMSSAAGMSMVIRPELRIVPNVVCIVTLAPLKFILL